MQNSELNTWPESGNNYEESAENNYYAAPSGIYTEAEKLEIIATEKIIEAELLKPYPMEYEGSGCDIYIELTPEATVPLNPNCKKYAL